MHNVWQVQEAKSRFSELVERTLNEGAQIITRHGKQVVVTLPISEYERLTRQPESLTQFLRQSPLVDSALTLERDREFLGESGIEA